jgi:hypothetical protein
MIATPLVAARYHGGSALRITSCFEALTCGATENPLCGRGDLNPHGVATNRT